MIKKPSTPPPCFLNYYKLYLWREKTKKAIAFSHGICKKKEVI